MVNSRFTVALHVLCLLANQQGKPLTSDYIAASVNTNAVVIRRLLAVLRKADLVKSQPGATGGWELVPKPRDITLGQVYQLIRPGMVFALHSKQPNPRCPVGKHIQRGLFGHYRRAQAAMEAELERATIAEVLHDVLANAT